MTEIEAEEAIAAGAQAIRKALDATLATARAASGLEEGALNCAVARALTTVVFAQGKNDLQIPLMTTCTLLEVMIDRGHGDDLGFKLVGSEPVDEVLQ